MRTRATLFLLWMAAAAVSAAPAAGPVDGHWAGAIEVPGAPLAIEIDFTTGPEGLEGEISIPVQGLETALADVTIDGTGLAFSIPGIPGDPTFAGTLAESGETITGTFSQGGAVLPFELARGERPADAARAALEGLSDLVESAIADWNVPGMALAVVRDGETVFARGFGLRDREGELPMTEDTLAPIGSTTKAFTTTLLGILADEGLLDWDAPLATYLPEFRLADPVTTSLLTPRDLVTHRSGLPRHDRVWYNNRQATREKMVARLAHLEATHPLRAKYQYNNLMFLTAGYLAERLTGESWEEALTHRLLEPLGMTRTVLSVDDLPADGNYAQPYRENDDDTIERIPFRNIDLIGPAGSINSSVREMSRWLAFNLSGGKVGDRALLNPTTLADIHSPHMTTGETPERREISQASYGLGWSVDTYRGHRRVAHGGAIDGFTTSVVLFPDDDLGMVAFTNRASPLPALVNRHAADRVLGLEPIDWLGEGLKERTAGRALAKEGEAERTADRREGTSPSRALDEYAGEYTHPGYGLLAIELDGERLVATFNEISTPLEHWHYDVWNGAESDGDPTFENMKYHFRDDVGGAISTVEAPFEATLDPIVFRRRADPRLSDPAYLERLTGRYALPGQEVVVELSGTTLTVLLPGQPLYSLEPALSGRFVLVEVPVIEIGFDLPADGAATAVTFYQPNGVFRAERTE